MFTASIPQEQREVCMCKSFGSSLQGPALQWYTNLANNFISSFAQLTDTFVEQFASSKKLEKLLATSTASNSDALNRSETTSVVSIGRRSTFHSATKKLQPTHFERVSYLTENSIRT